MSHGIEESVAHGICEQTVKRNYLTVYCLCVNLLLSFVCLAFSNIIFIYFETPYFLDFNFEHIKKYLVFIGKL